MPASACSRTVNMPPPGRDHAELYRVTAAGRKTREKRRFQHIRRNARILADDDLRAFSIKASKLMAAA